MKAFFEFNFVVECFVIFLGGYLLVFELCVKILVKVVFYVLNISSVCVIGLFLIFILCFVVPNILF